MKNLLIFLMCLFFIFSSTTCKDFHPFDRVYSFWVENSSDKLIYFLVSHNYPDTVIPDTYNKIKYVNPNSKTPYDSDEKWEEVFAKLPLDTLSIFIFDADTMSYHDWQTVRNGYKVSKRYDLSFDDLDRNKGIITYP